MRHTFNKSLIQTYGIGGYARLAHRLFSANRYAVFLNSLISSPLMNSLEENIRGR